MKPFLIVTDIHLTANPRDDYRWGLFPWLEEQVAEHGLQHIFCLGDITDAKDNHPSRLVNRIVEAFSSLAKCCPVTILQGNHDYLQEGSPFFSFFNEFDPGPRFVSEILDLGQFLLLPHTKTPHEDWKPYRFDDYDYVFMHQTVSGSIASNGMKMEGELEPDFGTKKCKIYSGDIHVPQVIGNVEYVGSPYHVHFGDRFNARCVIVDKRGNPKDVHFPCLQKFVANIGRIQDLEKLDLEKGDQLKVRIDLAPSMRSEWSTIKQQILDWCKDRGVDVHGLELVATKKRRVLLQDAAQTAEAAVRSPEAALRRFADHEKLPEDILIAGLELVK